ncbi:MAG TPA: PCRF domain-containing protein, partial [candidate division WOR-3 bacterium]|nr:PCRF domain-containing protein [candidate division WOR-3 bacterium]
MNNLEKLKKRKAEIELKLASPLEERERVELLREYKKITPLVEKMELKQKKEKELSDIIQLLEEEKDEEMQQFLEEEKHKLEKDIEELDIEIKKLLLPEDPDDVKNAIVEIRAGTGGDEAALFAADLFRMYSKYAEKKGYKISITDSHPTPLGGFKEITFIVEGPYAYRNLKYESGVHRVQRIPQTESG